MKHAIALSSLLFAAVPSFAAAQSASELEEASFILCNDMIGTQAQASACTDWILSAVTTASYRARFSEIAKLLTNEEALAYRIEAEKKLDPKKCEPMTAFELNFDILSALTESKDREQRANRLAFWGMKLAPEQMALASPDVALLDDFGELLEQREFRSYIIAARDSALSLVPSHKPDAQNSIVRFLSQLERTNPSLMTPLAQAVLLIDEFDSAKYESARARLKRIEAAKLPARQREIIAKKITASARALFQNDGFETAVCYPELRDRKGPADGETAILRDLFQPPMPDEVAARLAYLRFQNCDIDGAAAAVFDHFKTGPDDAKPVALMKSLIGHADSRGSDRLTAAISDQMSKLSGRALEAFKTRHLAAFEKLALNAGRRALEYSNPEMAVRILGPLEKLSGHADVRIELGRALQMQNKGAQARQIWTSVFEGADPGALPYRACAMTYHSFRRDNKAADAEALKTQCGRYETDGTAPLL